MSGGVLVLTTGGTIDKRYCPKSGALVIDVPAVIAIIGQAGVGKVKVRELMRKDSLEMTEADRVLIANAVAESSAGRVLVTHGTDTMAETASVIAAQCFDKTVLMTGAMVPYRFPGSDAAFNVGYALGVIRSLDKGVFVAMNGRVFPHDNVRKNHLRGRFEELRYG